MLVICVLYFVACWNKLVTFICPSNSTSNPCTNFGVWNLGVYPLELVYKYLKLLCEIKISPKIFVYVTEFCFEGSIPS
jgi:hypothetical protein